MEPLQAVERVIGLLAGGAANEEAAERADAAQPLADRERHARAAAPVGDEAHLGLGAAQQPLEGSAVHVLAPAAHLGRARLDDAEVRAHGAALVGREHLGEPLVGHRLDTLHARPPPRQVPWVAHGAPDLLRRPRDRAAAADARQRYSSSYVSSAWTSYPSSAARPLRNASSIRNPHPTTVPPSCSTSRHSVRAVPPVARRSSCTSTRAPLATASVCSSSASVPYSRTYSARTVAAGSLPGLRASTNPAPSSRARAGPSRNPRASAPMTTSMSGGATSASPVTAASRPFGSARTGVMSLNPMPGLGKSGISRMRSSRFTSRTR